MYDKSTNRNGKTQERKNKNDLLLWIFCFSPVVCLLACLRPRALNIYLYKIKGTILVIVPFEK